MNQEQPSAPPPPPPPVDPRRRLRELLAIPERDRTDAQWDEIIELEIQMAPGNRIGPQQQQQPGQGQKPASQQPKKNRSRWGSGRQHPPKK
jgi:hypothetical protein